MLRKRRPVPATLHICRDRLAWMAGRVSFTTSASRLYPAASFEALGLGLGRLPAVADQPQMEAEGWDPVLLAACWSKHVAVQ